MVETILQTKDKPSIFAGSMTGVIIGAFALITFVFYRDRMMAAFLSSSGSTGELMLSAEQLYLLGTIAGPLLVFLVVVLFAWSLGRIFDRYNTTDSWKILLASTIVGLGMGLITQSPVSELYTVGITVIAWLVFGVGFVHLDNN